MLRFNSIERSLNGLDQQLRAHDGQRQDKVVESIQNTALEMKQAIVKNRQAVLGSKVDTFA